MKRAELTKPGSEPAAQSAGPVDLAALRDMAGDVYWRRGEAYFRAGRVDLLTHDAARASAVVHGSEDYAVELRLDRTKPAAAAWHCSCDCPLGEDGETCKHIVAAALSWQAKFSGAAPAPAPAEPDGLAQFLHEQPAAVLLERLLAVADEYAEVHRSLTFWMRSARADSPQALRKALSALIGSPGLLDRKGSNAYARRLQELLALLTRTLADDPPRALDASEYALSRLLKIYARSDDSGGAIGGCVDALARLHARACTAATVDGGKLAAALLKLQLADDWGFFPIAAYRAALGEAGLESYGARLQKLWGELPAARGDGGLRFDAERAQLRRLLEDWCELRGDVDGLLHVKMRDLSAAYNYLDLVECALKHGREKAALDWAERGLKAFPDDARLRDMLAGFYERDGIVGDALKLRWKSFEEYPGAANFLALRTSAGTDWPAWRERALALVLVRESARPYTSPSGARGTDKKPWVTLRVQLHLAEQRVADALQAAAAGVCEPATLERLARAAEASHPLEAAALYGRLIPVLLHDRTGRYDDIVDLIQRRARLLPPEHAAAYEAALRVEYRAKRNFILLLDAVAQARR